MPEYDNYCALCGVVCGHFDHEFQYDRSVIRDANDVEWTRQTVVLCENPNAHTICKTYVTGIGEEDDFGYYNVARGDDENFDTSLKLVEDHPVDNMRSRYLILVHHWYTPQPFAIPMHSFCYREIFSRAVDYYLKGCSAVGACQPEEIDKDLLYSVLKAKYPQERFLFAPSLIDYGEAGDRQDQNWFNIKGEEWLVMNPQNIDRLQTYYRNMPRLQEQNPHRRKPFSRISHNIFSVLPEEIIIRVLSYLSVDDVNALRASTPVIARIELRPGFWKSRISSHMPWLYDLPYDQQEIDWRAVYINLSYLSHKRSPNLLAGLANRRRIWKIAAEIAEWYVRRKLKTDANVTNAGQLLLSQAISSKLPRLIWPEFSDVSLDNALLTDDITIIAQQRPVISFFMHGGMLTALSVREHTDQPHQKIIGFAESATHVRDLVMDKDSWVVGFIVFSQSHDNEVSHDSQGRSLHGIEILTRSGENFVIGRQEGDRRICHVSNGRIVIGITIAWSRDGGIVRLGLLEMPAAESVPDSGRFARYAGTQVSQHLWRRRLPDPRLIIDNFRQGYWTGSLLTDIAAKEDLVLGHSETELSSVIAIAVDVHFGSFRVDYRDGSSKRIGPRDVAMQVLTIDGRGGERLICFEVMTNHVITGIRFITNRGRQLVVGQFIHGARHRSVTDSTRTLVGICGHWTKSALPEARLDTTAALFLPIDHVLSASDILNIISQCSITNIELPTASWEPQGVILGMESLTERSMFLDFSRPLKQIEICLTHKSHFQDPKMLPLMSIILTYEDGSLASVGPTEFGWRTDEQGAQNASWCPCHDDSTAKAEELSERPHYHVEMWKLVHQQKVSRVQVWKPSTVLEGIQFVTENDTPSPLWGHCEGQPTDVIHFGGNDDNIVGLRCCIGSNQRRVNHPDMIIVAVQALTRKREPSSDDNHVG